jgi:uncharacterized protein YbjT (DUF2867 family)
MLERVLIAGGTGFVGRALIPALLGKAHVRVVSRRARAAELPRECEALSIDVQNERALSGALRDIDVAYYLVHGLGEAHYVERDRRLARSFVRAAESANVKRIIYLGALGDAGINLSRHVKSRQETGEILRRGRVPTLELRASIIIGAGSMVFEILRQLTERFPLVILPKGAERRCQPIAIADVVRALVAAAGYPHPSTTTLELGGSDVVSYAELMQLYAHVRGLRRPLLRMPIATPRLSGWWIERFTNVPASAGRELVLGLSHDSVVRDATAGELLKLRPMPLRDALELANREIYTPRKATC